MTRTPPQTIELIARLAPHRKSPKRLGVSPDAIYHWIRHGQPHARRNDTNRLRIPFDPDTEQECRKRVANSAHRTQIKTPATRGAV